MNGLKQLIVAVCNRTLLVVSLLVVCGCSKPVDKSLIAGLYEAHWPEEFGKETLRLNNDGPIEIENMGTKVRMADGSFLQKFKKHDSTETLMNRGNWSVDEDGHVVLWRYISFLKSERHETNAGFPILSGYRKAFLTIDLFGFKGLFSGSEEKIYMVINSDRSYYYIKPGFDRSMKFK